MAEKLLDQFVADALAAGQPKKDIADALSAAGWARDEIEDALSAYADVDFPVPVPRPRRYGSAREAFLYIINFAILGVVAFYVGKLAFAWIEFKFDDQLARQNWQGGASGLRWAIASLVVGYPIFLVLGARLSAARRNNPEQRTSRLRAWLTYITLIFAALTLIGDLMAVVYQFLSGEIGARFLSKAAAVGLIAGAILWNYSRESERRDARVDWFGRILAIFATIFTAILVIWAFTVVHSPQAARAKLADEERLRDLGVITRQIDCHRTYFGEMPQDLASMAARLEARGAQSPVARGCIADNLTDPLTETPYRYSDLGDNRYQICMTFQIGWSEEGWQGRQDGRHELARQYRVKGKSRYINLPKGAGEACFEFSAEDFETDKDTD
jgi:Domain of unknown function (DUF5671)